MGYQVNASNPAGAIGSRGVIESAEEACKLAQRYIDQGMQNVSLVDVETGETLSGDRLRARLAMILWNERNA